MLKILFFQQSERVPCPGVNKVIVIYKVNALTFLTRSYLGQEAGWNFLQEQYFGRT